ncbi:hypothetical protein BBOV_III000210 [Babesia bovis T2Bo]|uniref:Uncharacterized protein n=1 Tax=Babesia bovis TaxID=5865 RepID=A7AM04_BABBO|nr:hypothetical protein BBOV_III000210 [Babesia bovis T2Bo]EDO07588.1 hypothetical protein BBOV_III000210 [Babesia bovis T2Bo]|eukprot:XP_001611156.1 hypothetical protein [Babesia bovis T2Bo]
MEAKATEASSNKRSNEARLHRNLERSIEAHRLRLLKARGLNADRGGRLCECKKCDVTSTKISMRCSKRGSTIVEDNTPTEYTGNKNRQNPRTPNVVQQSSSRRQPPIRKSANVTKETRDRNDERIIVNVAVDVKDWENNYPKTHRDDDDNKTKIVGNVDQVDAERNDDDSEKKEVYPMQNSTRSQENADVNRNCVPEIDLGKVTRRLNSIRIVDSKGDEHCIGISSIETKILDAVNRVVRDKMEANETVSTPTKQEVNASPINKVDEPVISTKEMTPENRDVNKGNLQDDDRGRGVFSALLSYISCGSNKIAEYNADVKPVSPVENSAGVNELPEIQPDASLSERKFEDSRPQTSRFTLCGGIRSNTCCKGSGTDNTSVVTHSTLGGVQRSGIVYPNQSISPDAAVVDNETYRVTPHRMGTGFINQVAYNPPCQNLGQMAQHVNDVYQPTVQYGNVYSAPMYNPAGLPYQPYIPVHSVNYYQNHMNTYGMPEGVHTRPYTTNVKHQFHRRNNTSGSTTGISGCKAMRHNPRINAALQYVSNNAVIRTQNPPIVTGTTPIAMTVPSFRYIPRQSTGTFYTRNTGRAYGRQVKATMI